jgi:predicted house-cleaning noncanonical NTP pyrophosphatase (MazG superfamily)
VSASHAEAEAEAELRAKIIEYEGFLNDREEEMAAMMEVMENLQAEISNKNEIINHLQESKPQSQSQSESLPDATNNAKMQ